MNDSDKILRNEFVEILISKFGNERSSLLPVLQEIQKKFLYIDEHSQQEVARQLNIHPVEVNAVISFYSFLYDKPRGRNTVRICKNIICNYHGSPDIANALRSELGIDFGQTTKDGRITLEYANCFGMCDKSPSMLINEEVYENVNEDSALNIIRDLK